MRRVVLAVTAALALGALWSVASDAYGYPPYGRGGYGYAADTFSRSAADVRAAHSRYGFSTHPRSYYNAPYYSPYDQPYYQPAYRYGYGPGGYGSYYEYGYGFRRW